MTHTNTTKVRYAWVRQTRTAERIGVGVNLCRDNGACRTESKGITCLQTPSEPTKGVATSCHFRVMDNGLACHDAKELYQGSSLKGAGAVGLLAQFQSPSRTQALGAQGAQGIDPAWPHAHIHVELRDHSNSMGILCSNFC